MKVEQNSPTQAIIYRPHSSEENNEGSLNLGQVVAALRRKMFLIGGITALVTFASVFKAMNDTPTYSSKLEILTQRVTAETQVISSIPNTLTNSQTGVVDDNMLKVLTSPSVISPIFDQLKLRYPDLKRSALINNLSVSAALQSNSKVLSISYQDTDPGRVQTVLNAVSTAFLDYSLKSRQADVRQGIDFVNSQLPELQRRVENSQHQLQQLRQQYMLVDPESRGNQLSGQLATYSQQKSDIEIQLKQLRAMDAALAEQLTTEPTESIGSLALSNAPRYQAMLTDLSSLNKQIAQASILYQEASPDMQYLRQEREKLLSLLRQEGEQVQTQLRSQIQELKERDQAVQETISSLNGGITDLSGVSRKYVDIQRELQIATENLNQFLTKQAALEIDAAQQKTPWELLTPPTPPEVSAASVQRNLIQGIILGLLLGMGVALAVDKLSNILYSSKDIKQTTKLPILGVVPFNVALSKSTSPSNLATLLQEMRASKNMEDPTKQIYKPVPFIESFRFIYTNIRRFNPDIPVRSLVVSSPVLADGKSTVSLCLAQVAAALGQRVLLVDANLRHPQLHRYAALNNRRGLTDIIAGDAVPSSVLRQSLIDPNLFVLTAGLVPPDPTRFLSSPKMRNLIEKSSEMFDLVIYDTPPLLGCVDTSLITPYVDGMLLVVGLGKTKSSLLEQALEQLRDSSTPVLGVVANGSKELMLNTQEIYTHSYHNELDEQSFGETESYLDASTPVPSFLKNWNLD